MRTFSSLMRSRFASSKVDVSELTTSGNEEGTADVKVSAGHVDFPCAVRRRAAM